MDKNGQGCSDKRTYQHVPEEMLSQVDPGIPYRNGPEEVRDTILHEVAHALVGPGHGHDTVWKATAAQVGARPQRRGRTSFALAQRVEKDGGEVAADAVVTLVTVDPATGRCRPLPEDFARLFPAPDEPA